MAKIKVPSKKFFELCVKVELHLSVVYVTNERHTELRETCLFMNEDEIVNYLMSEFSKPEYTKF